MTTPCPNCGVSATWDGTFCQACRFPEGNEAQASPGAEPTSSMNVDSIADQLLDGKAVAARVAEHKEALFEKIRSNLFSALYNMEPNDTLSFNLMIGSYKHKSVKLELPWPPSSEYCLVLIAFMRTKGYEGCEVDSFVTPVAMSVVEQAIIEFYAKPEVAEALAAALIDQLVLLNKVRDAVRGEVSGQQQYINTEFSKIMKTNMGETITSEMAQQLGHSVHAFIQTSTGKSILTAVSKMLAGGAGKILVSKIAIVVGHVVGTAAFQAAMIAVVKKIGVTVLVKTVIGKVIIAILAVLGISASIPIGWVIAPLIIGLLAYEFFHLPEKLADKVPNEVVDVLRTKFDELNEEITKEIISGAFSQIISDELKKSSHT